MPKPKMNPISLEVSSFDSWENNNNESIIVTFKKNEIVVKKGESRNAHFKYQKMQKYEINNTFNSISFSYLTQTKRENIEDHFILFKTLRLYLKNHRKIMEWFPAELSKEVQIISTPILTHIKSQHKKSEKKVEIVLHKSAMSTRKQIKKQNIQKRKQIKQEKIIKRRWDSKKKNQNILNSDSEVVNHTFDINDTLSIQFGNPKNDFIRTIKKEIDDENAIKLISNPNKESPNIKGVMTRHQIRMIERNSEISDILQENNEYSNKFETPFSKPKIKPRTKKRNWTQGKNIKMDIMVETESQNIFNQFQSFSPISIMSPIKQIEELKGANKEDENRPNLKEEEEANLAQNTPIESQIKINPKLTDAILEFNLIDMETYKMFFEYIYSQPDGNHKISQIEINGADIYRLNPNEILNDSMINFYLKFFQNEILSENERNRIYIYNTYFFTKLTSGIKERNSTIDYYDMYHKVQTWTRNIDIFSKDFLFFPICDESHWSLLIVCHPNTPFKNVLRIFKKMKTEKIDNTIEFDQNPKRIKNESYEDLPTSCMIYFDSFIGDSISLHSFHSKLIRKYLEFEYFSKKSSATMKYFLFWEGLNEKLLPRYSPKVPQQENSFDCGVFMLHYAELFFKSSKSIENLIKSGITDFSHWFKIKDIYQKRKTMKKFIQLLFLQGKTAGVDYLKKKYYKQNQSVLFASFFSDNNLSSLLTKKAKSTNVCAKVLMSKKSIHVRPEKEPLNENEKSQLMNLRIPRKNP